MEGAGASIWLIVFLLALALAIAWLLLPLLLISIRSTLRDIRTEQARTNSLLEAIAAGKPAVPDSPPGSTGPPPDRHRYP